jgi:outer membrane protein OmpA-like peptidoglycan-associated protein
MNNATFTDNGMYDKSVFNKFTPLNSITFVDIHFETGKFDVLQESFGEIQKIATSLLNSKSIKIEIRGHTDDVGSEDDNQNLSEQRAKSVKKVLISMGIDPNRMTTKGFGESKPILPNTTPENRAKNRRTEFVIIEK